MRPCCAHTFPGADFHQSTRGGLDRLQRTVTDQPFDYKRFHGGVDCSIPAVLSPHHPGEMLDGQGSSLGGPGQPEPSGSGRKRPWTLAHLGTKGAETHGLAAEGAVQSPKAGSWRGGSVTQRLPWERQRALPGRQAHSASPRGPESLGALALAPRLSIPFLGVYRSPDLVKGPLGDTSVRVEDGLAFCMDIPVRIRMSLSLHTSSSELPLARPLPWPPFPTGSVPSGWPPCPVSVASLPSDSGWVWPGEALWETGTRKENEVGPRSSTSSPRSGRWQWPWPGSFSRGPAPRRPAALPSPPALSLWGLHLLPPLPLGQRGGDTRVANPGRLSSPC